MIGIRITGLKSAVKVFNEKNLTDSISMTMKDACEEAFQLARGYAPKDTGELVESIYKICEKDGFQIGATAKHAVFNEYGSMTTPIGYVNAPIAAKKVGVRPFIRPAMYAVARQYPEKFGKKYIERVMHG